MESIKHTMPRALAELVRTAPLSPGKVDFAWRLAVGPGVQRMTSVRLEDGLLLVDAASRAWSDAVSNSSRMILARLRSLLGEQAISRIEVRTR